MSQLRRPRTFIRHFVVQICGCLLSTSSSSQTTKRKWLFTGASSVSPKHVCTRKESEHCCWTSASLYRPTFSELLKVCRLGGCVETRQCGVVFIELGARVDGVVKTASVVTHACAESLVRESLLRLRSNASSSDVSWICASLVSLLASHSSSEWPCSWFLSLALCCIRYPVLFRLLRTSAGLSVFPMCFIYFFSFLTRTFQTAERRLVKSLSLIHFPAVPRILQRSKSAEFRLDFRLQLPSMRSGFKAEQHIGNFNIHLDLSDDELSSFWLRHFSHPSVNLYRKGGEIFHNLSYCWRCSFEMKQ